MIDLKPFEGTKVLVTGAAGLIGRTLIRKLFDWNRHAAAPISVVGMEFSEERAKAVLGEYVEKGLALVIADVRDVKPENMGVDYIIHAVLHLVWNNKVAEFLAISKCFCANTFYTAPDRNCVQRRATRKCATA